MCYIDSMELVNRYSDAAIEKSVDKQSFKNFEGYFQQADVLLIDDIQGSKQARHAQRAVPHLQFDDSKG